MKLKLAIFVICLTIVGLGIIKSLPAKAMDIEISSNENPVVSNTPVVTETVKSNDVISDNSSVIVTPTQATENSVPSTPASQNTQTNPTINPCQQ